MQENREYPRTSPRYSILKKIGKGGMGAVYLADDTMLGRKVAIKFILAELSADDRAKRRLIREAKSASALDHPNICTVYEVEEVDGRTYIVMQYVEGQTLDKKVQRGRMEVKEVLDLAVQVAEALAEAHSKGIAHRDIKPQNIMISPSGRVKVLDFGLAKLVPDNHVLRNEEKTQTFLTAKGEMVGTIPYMSPEQVRMEDIDVRTDIFSFGIVLYEVLCGNQPFARRSPAETLSAILTYAPPPPSARRPDGSQLLERIILKCLEKERGRRYRNGGEVVASLKNLAGISDAKTSPGRKVVGLPWKQTSRVTISALLLGLLVLFIVSLFPLIRSSPLTGILGSNKVNSIAVLPLSARDQDTDLEYLSDGIADSLIDSLSQVRDLKVIARHSAFRYKGREINTLAVSRELGVHTLLVGEVDQRGDGLTIRMELVDARDDQHIWGDKYVVKQADLLKVQQAIAREVVDVLRRRMAAKGAKDELKYYTANAEAYLMYLRGRHFWHKRTEEGLRRGIEYFNRSIDLDPGYALAYTGLADSYSLLGSAGYAVIPPAEAKAKAEAAALKALEIDATLAEAHTSLAIVRLQYDWDWASVESEFKRAIEAKPNYGTARYWHSIYLISMGRREESIAESREALDLDPLSLIASVNVARALYFARLYDQAAEQCRKTLEMDENFIWAHYILGLAYMQKGAFAEAIAAFQKCITLSNEHSSLKAVLGYAYAVSGRRDDALQILKELEERSPPRHAAATDLATVYAGFGDKKRAIELLEQACDERSSVMLGLKVEPMFDPLRDEPGFEKLLRRVGLVTE